MQDSKTDNEPPVDKRKRFVRRRGSSYCANCGMAKFSHDRHARVVDLKEVVTFTCV